MESTHDEYSGMLLNLHAYYICAVMVDVIQTPWKKCIVCSTCECRSLRDCTDISLWRCQNCSCGRRAAWKLTRYRMWNGTTLTNGPRKTSFQWIGFIPLFAECISYCGWSSSTPTLRLTTMPPRPDDLVHWATWWYHISRKTNALGDMVYVVWRFPTSHLTRNLNMDSACAIFLSSTQTVKHTLSTKCRPTHNL